MGRRRWPRCIVRMTCDKKFFNRTLLRYYKCLNAAAEALDGRSRDKGKKKKKQG